MIILNVTGNIVANAIQKNINGYDLTVFTIANNTRYKNKAGELKEETEFIRCTIWGKTNLQQLLYKGRLINVTGSLKLNRYTGNDGNNYANLDLRVSFFQLFGKNKKSDVVTETHTANAPAITPDEETDIVKDLPF